MQHYTSSKYIIHKAPTLLVLCLLTFIYCQSNAQTVLKYGDNRLPLKRVQYGKYTAEVTPTINLKSKYINKFTLEIELKWLDKKNRQVENIDGFVYLIDEYDNLNNYCRTNNKKPEDERKGVLKYDFTSSVIIIPGKNLKIGEIKDGFVNKKSNPIKIEIKKYFNDPITLDIVLYFGRIKKDDLIILSSSPSLKWKFSLPTRTSDEGLNCDQLIRKYSSEFENSKPAFSWARYEDKYDLYSSKETSKDEWLELQELVKDYNENLNESKAILAELSKNKDTIICEELNEIKGKIRRFLTLEKRVDALLLNIENSMVKSDDSGSENPVAYVSPLVFKKNAQDIERYYTALFNLEVEGGRIESDNPQFLAYKDSVITIGELQDSLLKIPGDAGKQRGIIIQLKKFRQNYNGSVDIINRYEPESEVIHQAKAVAEYEDPEPVKKRRRFSYWWIIIPVLIIVVVVIGLKKFFPHLMKIKKADKIRGRFKRQ